MALSLKETQTISEISAFLYSFLPGQAHPFANQSISFAGIANELELGQFWQGGSKQPSILSLLENTLDHKRGKFCPLMVEIVRRGMKYRTQKGDPITKETVQNLNQLIAKIGFKIPDLWDGSFLDSLPKEQVQQTSNVIKPTAESLQELRTHFLSLDILSPQQRGFEFEKFLNQLFDVFQLRPRASFRLQGEQLDGSLEFDNHTYLIEAKYQTKPVGQEGLLILKGKVEGTATWSRGLYISVSGFTPDGLAAFAKGRATNLIVMNGQDLYFIIDGKMSLPDVIKLKSRRAAETGEIMVSVQQLLLEA
jgi:hypothetical protein